MKIGVNRFLWLCSAACNPCEEALSMFSGQSRNFPELISEQHWERHSTQAAPKSRTRAPGLRNPTECICTLHTPWLRPGSAQDISQHLYKAGFSISQSAFQRAHLATPRREQQFLALRACVLHPMTSCTPQPAKEQSLLYRPPKQSPSIPVGNRANFQPQKLSPCKILFGVSSAVLRSLPLTPITQQQFSNHS